MDDESPPRPALNEALKALDTLSSKEIAEVKAISRRFPALEVVMDGCLDRLLVVAAGVP